VPDIDRPRSDGLAFDRVAALYDQVRPDYPAELYADLAELTGLRPGARLLEVGSGTGKATAAMAGRGHQIVCLEPGAAMIEIARARQAAQGVSASEVRFANTTFENWDPDGSTFDLVYAATSWHWVDPSVGYPKAAALLAPRGSLAIWYSEHGFPEGFDPFFTEIQDVYDRLTGPTSHPWPPPRPDEAPDLSAEIEASGCFGQVAVRRYLWERDYTAEEFIALHSTFSSHLTMDPATRQALYAEMRARIARRPGGTVTRHWLAILNVARPPSLGQPPAAVS